MTTVIDWYENKLIQLDIDFGGHKNYWIERKKIREQAKEMEKQQIIDAYQEGDGDAYNLDATKEWGEEYYNETYGSKGSDETLKENHIVDTNEMVEDTYKVWECCGMEECICKDSPMVKRLKQHLKNITPEQFQSEIDEINKDMDDDLTDDEWVIKELKKERELINARYDKLETVAKILAKLWFYGNFKWENPNERVMQMLMTELGYFPFKDEDDMIYHTKVDENLYKKASNKIRFTEEEWSKLNNTTNGNNSEKVPNVDYKKYSEWLLEQIKNGNIFDNDKFIENIKKRKIEEDSYKDSLKNKVCPNCNRLRLYHRSSTNDWRCSKCNSIFSIDMNKKK